MSRPTEIKLKGNVPAKLGGRYHYKDGNGNNKYLHIYYVEKDEKYEAKEKETVVLTPTANWTHDLGDGPWQRYHKNGKEQIVLSKDTWSEIKQADEVEVFNFEDYGFKSNRTGEVVDYLPRPEKTLEQIGEKVANMSEEKPRNKTVEMLTQAGLTAVKTAGANQVNELITQAGQKALMAFGVPEEYVKSEAGHKLMKVLGPIAIHYAVTAHGEMIDRMLGEGKAAMIQQGCELATQAALNQVMDQIMELVVPTLQELASVGMEAAKDSFATPSAEKDGEESKVQESSAVKELLKAKA